MIERASEFGAQPTAPQPLNLDRAHLSAGDMLREAREAQDLTIDVVAAAMKVSVAKLEALENDNISALPDPVFARALAASICRALRVDPAPVLAKMEGAKRPGLADADQTISRNLRSSAPRASAGNGGASGLPSRALLVVVALLLVGAAAIFFLPQSFFERVSSAFSGGASRGAATSAEPEPAAAPGTVVESALPSAATAGPPAVGAASMAPAEPVTPVTPAVPAAVSETSPPASDLVVFTARQDSWVTVSEAGGKPVLRRTIKAGETVGVGGTPPLSVTVGRAIGIDVQVRGKPLPLGPLTKSGGVARFEVKP